MRRIAFADESGTDSESPCYTIGLLSIDETRIDAFNQVFRELHSEHGVQGEAKWSKIKSGHGLIKFLIQWLHLVLTSQTGRFDCVVVHKGLYRNWSARGTNREVAFYKTYTLLLKYVAEEAGEPTKVYIDDRSDSYAKQTEVVEKVGNHMLRRLHRRGLLESVLKADSLQVPGIQVADLLTGAVNSGHRGRMSKKHAATRGKAIVLARMAEMRKPPVDPSSEGGG